VLLSVTGGLFDNIEVEDIPKAEAKVRSAVTEELKEICKKIGDGELLSDEDQAAISETVAKALGKNGQDDEQEKEAVEG
jgi:F-type H+/Na+-transporting ATPase subunit alpha